MSFFTNLKDKASEISKKAKKLLPNKHLQLKVDTPHLVALSSADISGDIIYTAHEDIHITEIEYTITELSDPIIWKKTEELEILHKSNTKKKIKIEQDAEKKLSFKLPITFMPTTSDIWAGDLSLMNKMSERSKLTAMNFSLIIMTIYTLPNTTTPKEAQIYKKKHDIRFE